MANSFGSLYIGSSSLRNQQNAMHTTANNLTNVETPGYVRQQVLFQDENYVKFANAAISPQQYGLGVSIGDVVHAREMFLDKLYRDTSSRSAFYSSCYEATYEVQTYFQEMEGKQFQEALKDFYNAMNDFGINPSDTTAQSVIIQKASLFLSRSQAVYSGLKSYQNNINTQISEQIDTINNLAKTIYDLNLEIQKIESGKLETAMDLRDARDYALDQLSAYGRIEYNEDTDGVVSVRFECHDLVDNAKVYEMGKKVNKVNDFITPYWPNTSDTANNDYDYVYNFDIDISSELNTDMGSLKALVLARGEKNATYYDLFHHVTGYDDDGFAKWEEMTEEEYLDGISMSVMENTQAEFDELAHGMMTAINDLFCPNVEQEDGTYTDAAGTAHNAKVYKDADGNILYTTVADGTDNYLADANGVAYKDANGNKIKVEADTKFLDVNTTPVGADGKLPPEEMFTRVGCERYTEYTLKDANGADVKVWMYNNEDIKDPSTLYSIPSVTINGDLLKTETKLPHMTQSAGQITGVAQKMGEKLIGLWDEKIMQLNPHDVEPCTFNDFYNKLVSEVGSLGNIYQTTSETMEGALLSADNKRQQIIGVSTDEELTNMIKYQNAYNAASRYINVVAEMIDTLINSMR